MDCNDRNPNIHPHARELCNNVDDDCDRQIDESLVQDCGTGLCVGEQTCTRGVWGDCSTSGDDAGVCAICDSDGIPVYDSSQDSDCSSTTCPADGCGVGDCASSRWTDYPESVPNYCSDIHTCEENSCSAVCKADLRCEPESEEKKTSTKIGTPVASAFPIENVKESTVTHSSAFIEWDTPTPTKAIVRYGTDPDLRTIEQKLDLAYTNDHRIILSDLAEATVYYYTVTSCDEKETCITSEIHLLKTNATSGTGEIVPLSAGGLMTVLAYLVAPLVPVFIIIREISKELLMKK